MLGRIYGPMRKTFSTTAGILVSFYFYGLLFLLNIAYIVVNYLLMRFLPRF